MDHSVQNSAVLPDGYIDQIRDLLEHLYDPSYLQNHLLTQGWVLERGLAGENGAAQIRRILIEAIESTNPGGNFYFRVPQARPYQMLSLHYVERLTILKAAHELGVSERQAYRDLRQGEENAALYLRNQAGKPAAPPPALSVSAPGLNREPPNRPEIVGPERAHSYIDLLALVRKAAVAVERLSSQQNVTLSVDLPESAVIIPTDSAVARQVLVNLFSRAIQQAQGQVHLQAIDHPDTFEVNLAYALRPSNAPVNTVDALLQKFIQELGWSITEATAPDGSHRAELHILKPGLNLLMIDDDEGFVALIKRYLTGYPVYIHSARNGVEGIAKAQQEPIGVIILDVMMPGLDGWEVLQTLRTDQRTLNIPVIICSVFNDPELARSLGASMLLPKPASQEHLVAALEWLGQLKNR